MPFCPKCRDESQDWAKTCPDCQVALVRELPIPPSPTIRPRPVRKSAKASDPLVLLATTPHKPVAEMWAGILEDKGIRCMVKAYSSEMFRGFPPTLSPIQPSMLQFDIYVLQSDVERAKETLDGIRDDSGPPYNLGLSPLPLQPQMVTGGVYGTDAEL